MAIKLKFPILTKVEYIDVILKGKTELSILGNEVEGKTWREFQKYVGTKIPAGNYFYVVKLKNSSEIHKGQFKAIGNIATIPPESVSKTPDPQLSELKKQIDLISTKLNNVSSGNGVQIDTLLEITKQSYMTRIEFMSVEITKRDNAYFKLENKNESLEKELDDADDIIEDLKSKTGISQYITIAKEFLQMKSGNVQPLENLQDSNTSDIPPGISEVLGVVNWSEVQPVVIDEIIHYLKIFAQKLPLKGA